jgi:acetyl-CoA acetyltransferase
MSYGGTNEAWIVDAVRTPIGRHGGSLSAVRPDDLGAVALEALMVRTGVPSEEVEDVYLGCANQAGEDNRDVARMSLLLAGFPETVAGATVNRLCGSGLEAVAAQDGKRFREEIVPVTVKTRKGRRSSRPTRVPAATPRWRSSPS